MHCRLRVRLPLLILVSSFLLPLFGCQGITEYVKHRHDDLSDCGRIRIAMGQVGLYAEVEATSWVTPSLGLMDVSLSRRFAYHWDPYVAGDPGQVRTAAFPALVLGWPLYGQHEVESGYADTHPYIRAAVAPLILMGNHHIEERSVSLLGLHHLIPNPRLNKPESRPSRESAWLGASVTVLAVNLGIGLNLLELTDLVLGFFGLDPLRDDSLETVPDTPDDLGEPVPETVPDTGSGQIDSVGRPSESDLDRLLLLGRNDSLETVKRRL